MENKTNIGGTIVVIILVIFLWWAYSENRRATIEAHILSAAEQVCEDKNLQENCTQFGYKVVDKYKDFAYSDDPRDDN